MDYTQKGIINALGVKPIADLLDENPGRTDEEELQLSYEEIYNYLKGNDISPESK